MYVQTSIEWHKKASESFLNLNLQRRLSYRFFMDLLLFLTLQFGKHKIGNRAHFH